MGRSSKFRAAAILIASGFVGVGFVGIVFVGIVLAANAAQARGLVPFAPHPTLLRPAVTAPMVPVHRPVASRVLDPRNPGLTIGQTLIAQGRQPRRRFFGGGLGYDGYGSYDAGGYGAVPQPAAVGADLPPPYAIPTPRTPCLPPQIIEIDGGLAHPPKTRVVYGTPACGGY